jgi:catechol 2,3-dioxygenase-like lactoylglutathione lyase family enzyme
VEFGGFDHIDCRVRSLALVEDFYASIMPELGLPERRCALVDGDGEWHDVEPGDAYNAVEFFEMPQPGRARFFMGFIEHAGHQPSMTRVAFRVPVDRFVELEAVLVRAGAKNVERSADMASYPAIFFEDPAGTKLELVARKAT